MPTLDLFKSRRFNIVKIGDIDYKIPCEYTVEEVERLLELQAQFDSVKKQYVEAGKGKEQLQSFWDAVFAQLEIILQRYQPETTCESLKKIITGDEALELLGFFDEYRAISSKSNLQDDVKKKLN